MKLNPHKEENFIKGADKYLLHLRRAIFVIVILSIVSNMLVSPTLGIKAIIMIFIAGFSANQSEYLFYFHTKNYSREKTKPIIKETMPYLDGILIALLLPIGTPIYVLILSTFFANYIVKNSFGGYSYNLFSVAISGYIFATLSFTLSPLFKNTFTNVVLEKIFGLPEVGSYSFGNTVALIDMDINQLFFNNTQLYLGYISLFFMIIIGGYLIYTKTIDYIIVATIFILIYTLSALTGIFYAVPEYAINNVTMGYTVFAVLILASDRTIIPKSKNARVYYSLIIAFITIVIRELTDNIDGILYAIMFAAMFVPMLNAKSKKYNLKQRALIWSCTAAFLVGFVTFSATQLTHDLDPTINEIDFYQGGNNE